ncbi:MAG: hypothetical protein ACW986_12230 [Promethearchaeota archaeon]|jgi:hypothetical protein
MVALEYYDFLNIVLEISKNLSSIQKTLIHKTLENYDISQVTSILDEEIDNLNRLIKG